MTVRPRRPETDEALGELFQRVRQQERLAEGQWVYVGSGLPLPDGDGTAPTFQNGWVNAGGGTQALRFKWLLAGGVWIDGSVIGGATGTTVFTLPNSPLYRDPTQTGEVRRPASDDLGNFVVYRIFLNGDVVRGI